MKKNYRLTGSYSRGVNSTTVAQFVEKAVGASPDYYAGELEVIKAELDKVTSILARLIEQLDLDADDINNIVQHYEEIEEVEDEKEN